MADFKQVHELGVELDFTFAASGSKLTLVYAGQPIFTGEYSECLLYLRGWRDGRAHYLSYESRGADE